MSASDIQDTEIERANWHWRNTMRPVRFFNLDARAVLPFCVMLFYLRPSTIVLSIIVTFIFWGFEKRGLLFPSAMRSIRVWIIGDKRYGWNRLKHRRLKDFG